MADRSEFESTPSETLTPVVTAWDLPPNPYWENLEARRQRRSLAIAILLFVLTLISTLAVGTQFASSYASGRTPNINDLFSNFAALLAHPQLLLSGVPFAFTLIGILLAHELGHFFACRYYGISASYPYFIPAPTLIGTLGAFIRIRSPISNRKALFDVGLAGPVIGFLFAVPALAIAIFYSRVVPFSVASTPTVFGHPLVMRFLVAALRPGVSLQNLLLHPVGQAAWVGLFATALNLLPAGQLDGGHILYSVAGKYHKKITLAVALLLIPLGFIFWYGWIMWSVLLLAIGFRHPPLLNRWETLDRTRMLWAAFAVLMFILCFMPMPVMIRGN
ncbi:MAG TPA: site-2 protease family protein [Candidatus Acidoferrum sp.]|jgi:membrane-associated protease RseP (regulator of RpoE activity)|nr:site-2 protease family protein [Candidatus Acidoferrum sp.]